MSETYRKVFIKSESDLPKRETVLIAHFKHSDRITNLIYFDTAEDIKYWLSETDWYLQPIDSDVRDQIIEKQAQIIEKKASCIHHFVKIILRNAEKITLRYWESNFINDYANMYSKLESELEELKKKMI
jgi:hypothetical protein